MSLPARTHQCIFETNVAARFHFTFTEYVTINTYNNLESNNNCLFYTLEKGLDHVADNILSYLDADSLFSAELVSKEWNRVISEGMLWKKLIERKVRSDSLWRGLAERKKWIKYLFVPRPGEYRNHSFYRQLYPVIMKVSFINITGFDS